MQPELFPDPSTSTVLEVQQRKISVHHTSKSAEHYTPQKIIDATLRVMGAIDLDPCSNSHESPNVPAAKHYTAKDDGLIQVWDGRVYMNPPYGRGIVKWVDKLFREHVYGKAHEAIALLPARTDTRWFRILRDFPVCFISGRLVFGNNTDYAPFPSAVFYLGTNDEGFISVFEDLGDIYLRAYE